LKAGSSNGEPGLTLVAALSRNRVIGRDNALPWHIGADLKRFKALTMGKPILMGRRTYESIGRALPGRENLVLTRGNGFAPAGVQVLESFEAALELSRGRELMVIGGGDIYRQALPLAKRMHLTLVDLYVDGDVSFPPFDARGWRVEGHEEHPAGPNGDEPGYRFVDYVRL
jgi:dihydrofolate reductase